MRYALMALAAAGVVAATTTAHAQRGYYGYYYDEPPPDARTRVRPGDPGYNSSQPRIDPRNGGTYCVEEGYTVQNGVCKPYTGR